MPAAPPKAKLNFRMPEDLRERLAALAELEGLSVNSVLIQAVQSYVPYRMAKLREMRKYYGDDKADPVVSRRAVPVVGADQKCPCGSGLKYKRCHGRKA